MVRLWVHAALPGPGASSPNAWVPPAGGQPRRSGEAEFDPPLDQTLGQSRATGAVASWSACSVSCRFRPLRRGIDRHADPAGPTRREGVASVHREGRGTSTVSASPSTKAAADAARTPGRSAPFVNRGTRDPAGCLRDPQARDRGRPRPPRSSLPCFGGTSSTSPLDQDGEFRTRRARPSESPGTAAPP